MQILWNHEKQKNSFDVQIKSFVNAISLEIKKKFLRTMLVTEHRKKQQKTGHEKEIE